VRNGSSGDLLYVAGGGQSYVLTYPGLNLVGKIKGGAEAACSDANGNVFLVQDLSITEYAHGATTSSATLSIPGPTAGGGCSVDPVTGNLAVAYGATNVAVYPDAQGSPETYHDASGAEFCGYDDQGDLFVDATGGGAVALSELPVGGANFAPISISPALQGTGWQVQWDGNHVTVEVIKSPAKVSVARLAISGSTATILGETQFKGFTGVAGQSWVSRNEIFMPVGRRSTGGRTPTLGAWRYPNGGKPQILLKNLDGQGKISYLYGVAISTSS
jgi:hypothetical protein